ncbi:MAG: ceramidase domain-containing protein [Rhodomicrobium sp.]
MIISMASWFGNMDQPVHMYCERANSSSWNAEPLNAVSNIAFFVAAWAAWRLQKRRPNTALRGPIEALWIFIAIVGAGSLTFHTIATRWAEWADVIPILVFMIAYCWLILTVFFKWPVWLKTLTTFAFFAATFYLESDAFEKFLWGGAMYLPTLFFLVGAGIGIWRCDASAGKAFFAAAGLFVLSFIARTIDVPVCSHLSIGTHYFWHLFNAAVLFLLVRTIILHAPGGEQAAGPGGGRVSPGL